MMVIRGINERHEVRSFEYGIGFDTAALSFFCRHMASRLDCEKDLRTLGAQSAPDNDPAIEERWSKAFHCFGSRSWNGSIRRGTGYFLIGRDGSLRQTRLCQLAGQYAVDGFIGSTLQMDPDATLRL